MRIFSSVRILLIFGTAALRAEEPKPVSKEMRGA